MSNDKYDGHATLADMISTHIEAFRKLMRVALDAADNDTEASYIGHELAALAKIEQAVRIDITDDLAIRRLLFLQHGNGEHLPYSDDGEMSCGTCHCDFLRDSADVLQNKIIAYNTAKLAREHDTGSRELQNQLASMAVWSHQCSNILVVPLSDLQRFTRDSKLVKVPTLPTNAAPREYDNCGVHGCPRVKAKGHQVCSHHLNIDR